MTRIKICGLTNLNDALHAWRCGADMLGFVMVPASPRCVAPGQVAQIVSQLWMLGCQCQTVAVMASDNADQINQTAMASGVNLVQLHCSMPTPDGLAVPHMVAHQVRESVPWQDLMASKPYGLVLDAYSPDTLGGTGEGWDYGLLDDAGRPQGLRVLVAGGLNPDNVGQAVSATRPWGVDVSSGIEAEPGRKDPEKVKRFIENVRREDLR